MLGHNHPHNRSGAARDPFEHVHLINHEFKSYLFRFVLERPGLSQLFGVTFKEINLLERDTTLYRQLAATPFFVLTPVLQEIADWRSLIDGRFPTETVEGLRNLSARIGPKEQEYACSQNRVYLSLMQGVLEKSSLAAPILGISVELADYLRTVPKHELDRAVSTLPCPMFRWRITSSAFFIEYETRRITMPAIAHYFMQHSPARFPAVETSAPPPRVTRYDRACVDAYGEMLARIGCRSRTIINILGTTKPRAGKIYKRTMGVASPTGREPKSLEPLFKSASVRIQSTALVWLYRLAFVEHACEPLAFVEAYEGVKQIFGTTLEITADRASLLIRAIDESDKGVGMAPCRTCKISYLIKAIELASSYQCPCCSGTLRRLKTL